MKYIAYTIFVICCFYLSISNRNFNIKNRVPHADEAEQATTSIELLNNNLYQYNPNGHHGATLYYWTDLISVDNTQTANIQDFRKTLNIVALALILSVILTGRYLGKSKAFLAAAFLSLTSIFTIYSGYFVHEIIFALFVFLTAIFTWRFVCTPTSINALILGTFIGLTQATKETAPIAFASIFLSIIICSIFEKRLAENLKYMFFTKHFFKFSICLLSTCFAFVAMFYTSFFTHIDGLFDAVKSYGHFFEKSQANEFAEGFFYYFKLLTLQKSEGAYFGELPITILSIIGVICAIFWRKSAPYKSTFAIFSFLCGIIAVLILSLITYKTPWLILSPVIFLSLTAGVAIDYMVSNKNKIIVTICSIFILVLGYYQYKLNINATKFYNSDSRNPFIYSHTLKDYNNLINSIKHYTQVSEYKNDIPVAFISNNSQWPAPFDLRNYRNIGYWQNDSLPENIDVFQIIVCDFSSVNRIDKIINKSSYEVEYYGLRENLILTTYIKKELLNNQ